MKILKQGSSLVGGTIEDFEEDAVRINGSNITVRGLRIKDTLATDKAHRDAIQLIPPSDKGVYNQQYALGILSDVIIKGNLIESTGSLQGVFCSDGLVSNLSVENNVIITNSQHKITINGLLSGDFSNNLDGSLNPLPVVLNPARIGGGISSSNVWVISFSDKDIDYKPIHAENLTDNRRKETRKGDIYLHDFDLNAYYSEIKKIVYKSTGQYCKSLQSLAKAMGCKS